MKKIIFLSLLFIMFSLFSVKSFAQMMGSPTQDEATGKAIWDKFQNKQITCQDLKDDDFDKLGDFFMGSMMGSSHNVMDQMMTQRLGQEGEQQMHIAMGKRLSGCDTNAPFPQGSNYFLPMMGYGGYGYMTSSWGWGVFGTIIFLLLIIFLMLGIIYFWRGINKKNT